MRAGFESLAPHVYINKSLFVFIFTMLMLALLSAIALVLIWTLAPATTLAQCTRL